MEKSFDHTPLEPNHSWVRRNRGVLSALLFSAIFGTAATEWFRSKECDSDPQGFETPLIPLATDITPPAVQSQAIPTSQAERGVQRHRAKASTQTPKSERARVAWEALEGEKRVSAQVILSLSPDDLERNIREAKLTEIPSIQTMAPALRDLQSALKGGDEGKIRERATELLRLASLLETDDAFERYWAKRDDPDFSEEFKTVLIPAVKEAENLLSF